MCSSPIIANEILTRQNMTVRTETVDIPIPAISSFFFSLFFRLKEEIPARKS